MYKDNIPPELAETCRWSPYGEGKKGITGWNSPENWKTLDEVPGDAFFTLTDTSFLLIDGDKILGENGKMIPEAWNDLQRIYKAGGATYCEKSTSGKGIHMVYDLGDYADSFQGLHNSRAYIEYKNHPYMEAKGTVIKAKYPRLEFFFKAKQGVYFTGNRQGDQERVVSGESAAAALREIQQMLKEHQTGPDVSAGKMVDKEELKISDDEKPKVLKALEMIPCRDLNYDTWIQIGIAIYNCGFPFEVFDEWSRKDNPKYNESKQHTTEKKWKSFQSSPSMWNAGTIFNLAKDYGWQQHVGAKKQAPSEPDPAKPTKKSLSDDDIYSSVKRLNDFEEKPVEWLLYPYIPRGETVLLAAEGGTGKGFITASIVAGITNGKTPPFMGDGVPFDGDPETVLYLTTEDDVEKVLRGRHKNAGVNADNVFLISKKDEIIQQITYTDENEILKKIIKRYKPSLVVFDPVQSFLPEHVRMGERHHMRTCMNHLNVLASECDTSFLVLCHTNKREGTTKARNQISDSSDLWDIARSVLMTGETGDGDIKFLSLEKANYTKPCDTVLYRIVDPGKVEFVGKTSKRFKDFVIEANETIRSAPKRAEATSFIIDTLKEAPDNSMQIKDLDEGAKAAGISQKTYRRAKEDLKKAGKIKMWQSGSHESKKWLVRLVNQEENNNDLDIHNLEL